MTNASTSGGFVLLVMLGVIGVGSLGLLLAVEMFLPPLADRRARADDNLTTAVQGSLVAYRRGGAFPADLDGFTSAAGLPSDGRWRIDPFGAGEELDYSVSASGVRLRSRGPDGQLGTGDDLQFDVGVETRLRVRTRLRLRMLRAVLSQSQYRQAGTMSASERQQMVDAMRDYAAARRAFWTADTATRASLTTAMNDAAAVVDGLVTAHGMPPLPGSLTGAGGLMSQLGMQDFRAVDGRGSALVIDPTVGFVAVGADAMGGSDDDL